MCVSGREQCKVLFPYEAQNEDELTIKEGEIINIITKVGDAVRLVFQFVLD